MERALPATRKRYAHAYGERLREHPFRMRRALAVQNDIRPMT